MNTQKTKVFFSSNTDDESKRLVEGLFEASLSQHYEKYLGLPSLIGKSKCQSFKDIKERVWSKIQGWKEKLLSQ